MPLHLDDIERAPVLYRNCTVITCDPQHPRASAFFINYGEFEAVGDIEDLDIPPYTPTIDLEGATVVPGFNDCHMHILSLGLTLGMIDVSPSPAPDLAGIRRAVAERAATAANGSWLLGRGYNQNLLPEGRHPSRHELDANCDGHPVALWHTSGHVMAVNSKALELAGVTNATPDPPGGQIERDGSGNPTGVLKETAMALIREALPEPTVAEARDAILAASRVLTSEGITSASDAATGQHMGLMKEFEAYRAADDSTESVTRIMLMPLVQDIVPDHNANARDRRELVDLFEEWESPEELDIGAVKIFTDGALTTRTASLLSPYVDSPGTGLLTWKQADLNRMVRAAHDGGWQIAAHAIGDAAIEACLEAFELAQAANHRPDARHRIEHCTLASRDQIRRMATLGLIAVLQPEDIAVLGDAYPPALGDERAANNSPVSWFGEFGVPVAFSSDRPVTPGHPLAGIRAAVERRTASGDTLGTHHCLSVDEALALYTSGGAYATFVENRGQIKADQRADFVVLDRDITSCPSEDITKAQVLMTYVSGQMVYQV